MTNRPSPRELHGSDFKTCTKCGKEQPITCFSVTKLRDKLRVYPHCWSCKSAAKKKYYYKDPELLRRKTREWALMNKELVKERGKQWRAKNRERLLAEKKAYYQANKQKSREQSKAWIAANLDRKRKTVSKWMRMKRETDPEFAMLNRLRHRINSAIKGTPSAKKEARTLDLVGCTIAQFKAHIESKFQEGMTWENRSEWHLDHIIPCASFNMLDPEQQRACFHYSNIQPLWAVDNMRKGARLQWAA